MSGTTELNYWPAPLGGLVWSQDCELAIGGNEMVQLLIPNLEPHGEIDKDSEQSTAGPWQIISLATSLWTSTELPLKHPAPYASFSVGEEISTSAVSSLEWSPPGLAKYRRSALAVLTSNLVLSLWAPENSPRSPANWGRRLIINDCIGQYLDGLERDENYEREEDRMERRRLRMRLRSFSWCPPNPYLGFPSNIGSRLCWGPYILAVANDDNQVLFILVESPYSSDSRTQGWNATVIAHFSLNSSETNPGPPAIFEDFMRQQSCFSHIAWSPWSSKEDGRLESIISYASNDTLYARNVSTTIHEDDRTRPEISVADNETKYHDISLRYGGPLRWCPKICGRNQMFLVAFSRLQACCFTVSNVNASEFTKSLFNLDENWDPISGVTFKFQSLQEVRMYYSYYMSTARASTVGLRLPISDHSELPLPSWQTQTLEAQAHFSAANDLAGNAYVKVWGLALSPLGDLFATLSTRHPSDMMEYLTVSEQQCLLSITNPAGSYGSFALASGGILGHITSEAAFFSIKRWFGYNSETSEAASTAIAHISNQLLEAFGPVRPQESAHNPIKSISFQNGSSLSDLQVRPRELVQILRRDVFFNLDTIIERHDILVARICAPQESTDTLHLKIARTLAEAALRLPKNLSDNSPLSQKILATFSLVLKNMHAIDGKVLSAPGTSRDVPPENCGICESPIKVESLDWAKCREGHHFKRCGLSFLAIQGPGITKHCGVCRVQYLKEEYITREDQSNQNKVIPGDGARDQEMLDPAPRDSGQMSLAQVLFSACDVCVYCGGKFAS